MLRLNSNIIIINNLVMINILLVFVNIIYFIFSKLRTIHLWMIYYTIFIFKILINITTRIISTYLTRFLYSLI